MSVLAEIVAAKRVDVARRMDERPLALLERDLEPTSRRFADALRQPGLRFVLECKHASPSEGVLRSDFDPAVVADAYRDVADAISVLTDTPYFRGSFDHLRTVRAAVPQPILCKDFVVDPYQVAEARSHGADAVLLMLSVLDDAAYRACATAARALFMDCLTEVHDEAELDRALALDARVIGVNNRDLKTLRIDLATTARLAPRIPRDRVIVCESGIRSRSEIDAVAEHVDAFLVGSHLMKHPRIDLAARTLVYGVVKVCGLRSREAIALAYKAGASLGGMIFAETSARFVDDALAAQLVVDSPLPLVGVFVDASVERVAERAATLGLHAVQLHGDEPPAFIRALRPRLPTGCEVWKAIRVRGAIPRVEETGADRLLLDAHVAGIAGGTGRTFDWTLLADHPQKDRSILAGGINPGNVALAHRVGAGLLDVSSGVESAPGVKDPDKLRALFAALRGT